MLAAACVCHSVSRAEETSSSESRVESNSTDVLRQSRSLFSELRGLHDSGLRFDEEAKPHRTAIPPLKSVPETVPPVPTQEQLKTASQREIAGSVRLTSGTDAEAGVITIPNILPPADIADASGGVTTTGAKKRAATGQPKKIQKWRTPDGTFWKRNLKKGTTKVQRLKTWFNRELVVEIEPTEFTTDDYYMPILLVGGSDEVEATVVSDDDDEDEDVSPLARNLTNIRPTLAYAWGDLQPTDLPPDFYARMESKPVEMVVPPRTVLQWAPTNLWYHPLYFEDVSLERYGHTHKPWIQPFVSSGKFFGQALGLPYQMTLHPPRSREFALGYYQPGEWAPKKKYQIPFNEEAAATEFLWVTGLILLIP